MKKMTSREEQLFTEKTELEARLSTQEKMLTQQLEELKTAKAEEARLSAQATMLAQELEELKTAKADEEARLSLMAEAVSSIAVQPIITSITKPMSNGMRDHRETDFRYPFKTRPTTLHRS